jgi:hypothetical protein
MMLGIDDTAIASLLREMLSQLLWLSFDSTPSRSSNPRGPLCLIFCARDSERLHSSSALDDVIPSGVS